MAPQEQIILKQSVLNIQMFKGCVRKIFELRQGDCLKNSLAKKIFENYCFVPTNNNVFNDNYSPS
jgi:hypothetical protein